ARAGASTGRGSRSCGPAPPSSPPYTYDSERYTYACYGATRVPWRGTRRPASCPPLAEILMAYAPWRLPPSGAPAPPRHQRLPPRPGGALGRRPQARPVPRRDARALRRVGARLPRGGARPRRAARADPPRGRSGGPAAAGREEPPGPDPRDDAPRPGARRGARAPGSRRLRAQEGLAQLRHGARAGVRQRPPDAAPWHRPLRARAHGAAAAPAGRGGGASPR